MSILPSSTSSTSSLQLPDLRTVEFNAQIPWKASDRILEEAIGKLINLDEIVDRLQGVDCQHCTPFTHEQVKFAFLKWIENHLESIELQPEWFIHQDFKHFERHLPELDGSFFPEEEYDQNVMYEEQAAQFSQLEDEFERTPREEATAAINW
ncbi:hypothetical protein QUA81_13435 [Microcoleus sp. F6_B4]